MIPLALSADIQLAELSANPGKVRNSESRSNKGPEERLEVAAMVHEADIRDRDGAVPLPASIRKVRPWLRHVFADGGYAGFKLEEALAKADQWTFEIVKRSDTAKGFELLPRRWVIERTLAWLNRNRRLAKDFEATIESAMAWLMIASVKLMTRRLSGA